MYQVLPGAERRPWCTNPLLTCLVSTDAMAVRWWRGCWRRWTSRQPALSSVPSTSWCRAPPPARRPRRRPNLPCRLLASCGVTHGSLHSLSFPRSQCSSSHYSRYTIKTAICGFLFNVGLIRRLMIITLLYIHIILDYFFSDISEILDGRHYHVPLSSTFSHAHII